MFSTLCTSPRRNTGTKKAEKITERSLKTQERVRKIPHPGTKNILQRVLEKSGEFC